MRPRTDSRPFYADDAGMARRMNIFVLVLASLQFEDNDEDEDETDW